jgi:hypothetical protein
VIDLIRIPAKLRAFQFLCQLPAVPASTLKSRPVIGPIFLGFVRNTTSNFSNHVNFFGPQCQMLLTEFLVQTRPSG